MSDAAAIEWLLAGDPAIRWQVLRDLLDAPESEWQTERAKVETEGWGADSLALEDPDGSGLAAPSCRRDSPGASGSRSASLGRRRRTR